MAKIKIYVDKIESNLGGKICSIFKMNKNDEVCHYTHIYKDNKPYSGKWTVTGMRRRDIILIKPHHVDSLEPISKKEYERLTKEHFYKELLKETK